MIRTHTVITANPTLALGAGLSVVGRFHGKPNALAGLV